MRRAIVIALISAAVGATPASAATFCVGDEACVAAGGAAAPTLQAAIDAADATVEADTIELGKGSFDGTTTGGDAGNEVDVVGEGAETIVNGAAGETSALSVANSASSISGLAVVMHADNANGVVIAGSATGVTLSAPEAVDGDNGFVIGASSVLSDVTVDMPITVSSVGVFAFGGGTIEDSTITATRGVSAAGSTTVRRSVISASQAVFATQGTSTIEDSLVKVVAGDLAEIAFNVNSGVGNTTLNVRHVTAIATVEASGARAFAPDNDAVVNVANSVFSGFVFDLVAVETDNGPTATVNVSYTIYDPAKTTTNGNDAQVNAGAGNLTAAPRFVDAAAGDYHLAHNSVLIDLGDPAAPGQAESPTDLDGLPRVVDGDDDGTARRDIGAYEYQRRSPILNAASDKATAPAGEPIQYVAIATDPDPGETPTVTWAFDDGDTATGLAVTKAFATPGTHVATVTATDPAGETAVTTVAVTVTTATGAGTGTGTGTGTGNTILPAIVKPLSIRASLKPRRDRRKPYSFTLSGSVTLPAGVAKSVCTGGRILVGVAATREAKFVRATLRSDCTYRVRFRVKRRTRRIRLEIYSLGTARMQFFGPKRLTGRSG